MKYIIHESQLIILKEGLAFEEVYKETFNSVYKDVCMKYAKGDRDLANEFCQVGFIKVFNNLDKYSGVGNLTGWVKRVVQNEIINIFRKRKLPTSDVDLSNIDIEVETPDKGVISNKLMAKDLLDAIKKLPEGYRSVLTLFYFAEMTHKEIGNVLGIDEGTSRSQLSKAKLALKKIISPKLF